MSRRPTRESILKKREKEQKLKASKQYKKVIKKKLKEFQPKPKPKRVIRKGMTGMKGIAKPKFKKKRMKGLAKPKPRDLVKEYEDRFKGKLPTVSNKYFEGK